MRKVVLVVLVVVAVLLMVACEGKEKTAHDQSADHGMNHGMGHAAPAEGQETIVCPVMNMEVARDDAIVFTHEGHEFAVCCSGCINTIKENFDEYKEHGTPVE